MYVFIYQVIEALDEAQQVSKAPVSEIFTNGEGDKSVCSGYHTCA